MQSFYCLVHTNGQPRCENAQNPYRELGNAHFRQEAVLTQPVPLPPTPSYYPLHLVTTAHRKMRSSRLVCAKTEEGCAG